MKVVLSLAAVLALAAGFSLTALDGANAQCVGSPFCGGPAPAPHPLPMPGPVPAPPPPCGQGGCGGTAFVYVPNRFYAYRALFGHAAFSPKPGNCYWRRDCW